MADHTVEPRGDKTAINSARASRRRAVGRAVRDQRERLTSTSGTRPAFDYELNLTFARNRLSAAYALPILVVVIAATASLWINFYLAAGWAVLVLSAHVASLALCRHFTRLPVGSPSMRVWTRRFILVELLDGFAWSAVLIIASQTSGPGIDVFQFATMLIIVSVSTMLASTVPAAALAGAVPATLILAGIYVSRGDFVFIALSIMAIGTQFFFLVFASRLYSATLTMLEYRAEKDLLIAELGTAKSISDESRRRAEEANLAKSRFLASMSHELRTPLNAILGFSEVMKSSLLGPIENASYRDYINDIHTSGQHLLNLINEILDLSRIEAGRQELSEEPLGLGTLVSECNHLMQLKARNKDINTVELIDYRMPRLWADDRSVRQIVLNLLSNAIKFTPSGGEITIKVGRTKEGGQFVSVRDNGPGIAPEEIPIVLSAFGQGAIAIKSTEQGAGLGLPIVQALMTMHDGEFELKSKLREGTEAIVTFPRTRVMEALPPMDAEPPRRSWLRAG